MSERDNVVADILAMSTLPEEGSAFDEWVTLDDALPFLETNAGADEVVVYAGLPRTFIHAVVVPQASLNEPVDIDALMDWHLDVGSSWGISQSFHPANVWISPPLEHSGHSALENGEQLVYARDFEGYPGKKHYFEILQKFVHVFSLHLVDERSAYCRLDRRGDLEDMIRIVESTDKSGKYQGTIITMNRGLLEQYLVLSDAVLVRAFDFMRLDPSRFPGWIGGLERNNQRKGDIVFAKVEQGKAAYMRGIQIIHPQLTRDQLIKRLDHFESEPREYATFIAQDLKTGRVQEISTAPDATVNYFTQSDLPFEMSPVFFRPEVLQKYKADSDKYRFQDRSISCRGSWHLETYDINEAGQVHTYIVYLRRLPYEEQQHWKAYNEPPKASISDRAFASDFEGKWTSEYDPLQSLKQLVAYLDARSPGWWHLKSDKAQYPITTSADEWAEELLRLDQMLVESFDKRWLKAYIETKGGRPDPRLGSLKLVEECLTIGGFEPEDAGKLVAPFQDLHHLRSKLKGHATGDEALRLRREALKLHNTFNLHFRDLCSRCDEALRVIARSLDPALELP